MSASSSQPSTFSLQTSPYEVLTSYLIFQQDQGNTVSKIQNLFPHIIAQEVGEAIHGVKAMAFYNTVTNELFVGFQGTKKGGQWPSNIRENMGSYGNSPQRYSDTVALAEKIFGTKAAVLAYSKSALFASMLLNRLVITFDGHQPLYGDNNVNFSAHGDILSHVSGQHDQSERIGPPKEKFAPSLRIKGLVDLIDYVDEHHGLARALSMITPDTDWSDLSSRFSPRDQQELANLLAALQLPDKPPQPKYNSLQELEDAVTKRIKTKRYEELQAKGVKFKNGHPKDKKLREKVKKRARIAARSDPEYLDEREKLFQKTLFEAKSHLSNQNEVDSPDRSQIEKNQDSHSSKENSAPNHEKREESSATEEETNQQLKNEEDTETPETEPSDSANKAPPSTEENGEEKPTNQKSAEPELKQSLVSSACSTLDQAMGVAVDDFVNNLTPNMARDFLLNFAKAPEDRMSDKAVTEQAVKTTAQGAFYKGLFKLEELVTGYGILDIGSTVFSIGSTVFSIGYTTFDTARSVVCLTGRYLTGPTEQVLTLIPKALMLPLEGATRFTGNDITGRVFRHYGSRPLSTISPEELRNTIYEQMS